MIDIPVAIIVGGTGGIGTCIMDEFQAHGYHVWGISRKEKNQDNWVCVNSIEKIEQALEHIYDVCGRIDVLVNAAGKTIESPALMTDIDEWNDVFKVNSQYAFIWSCSVAKYMMLAKFGRIILFSSIVARYGGRGECAYAASKAAIEALVRVLALELGSRNITVNAIAPGVIKTGMTKSIVEQYGDMLLKAIPVHRFGDPQEVAKLAVFLASAGYINGQTIAIDGGLGIG